MSAPSFARADEAEDEVDVKDTARRLSSILDYVAADYGAAVQDGVIAHEGEYAEQLTFLDDAKRYADRLPSAPGLNLTEALGAIRADVEAKVSVDRVAPACRALRQRVLDGYGVELVPARRPSLDVGRALYVESCVKCHGTTGAADGPAAADQDPRPRSFLDDDVMQDLSPARAFNAITDGIKGTGMASFEAYSEDERWSLAFFVFTLRHSSEQAKQGEDRVKSAGGISSVGALAGASDAELSARGTELDPDSQRALLAFLRREAPYRVTAAPLEAARRELARLPALLAKGEKIAARDAVTAAYLDGFEPVEAALRTREPGLVQEAEAAFLALRGAIDREAPKSEVNALLVRLEGSFDRAEALLYTGSGPGVAFGAAALVLLREGIESVLLILLLLGLVHRAGGGSDVRAVHAGWLAAVALGVATWFASGLVIELGGARRELIEGIVALLAAGVLLYASHFVLARRDAVRRVGDLKARFERAGAGSRGAVLFMLGFAAVYREAFEVVLFLRAILLDAPNHPGAVAGGALTGVAVCFVVFALFRGIGRRLQPGPLLTASGALLCVLAVIMAGKGVRALQEAGVVSVREVSLPTVDWLGIYPTLQSSGAQVLVLIAIAAIAYWGRVRSAGP